eukprot:m.335928 g.335928  ORF g.335928 m.335928 type:complete len:297 (+) comp17711_c1_seq1:149-1039(+)
MAETKESSGFAKSVKSFLAGGGGGMSLVAVGHPFDTVKVKLMAAEAGKYTGIVDCVKQTVRESGVRGLYRGMAAPLAGITPIFAVYFLGYEHGKQIVGRFNGSMMADQKGSPTTFGLMMAGAYSSIYGTILMVPGDRVKCILQVDNTGKFKGPIDVAKVIYRENGIRGFYKGTGLTLMRDGPGSMAYYGGYEVLKKAFTPEDGEPSTAAILTAGGLAGVLNWLVAVPPDVIKTRLQTAAPGQYPGGGMQIARELVMKEGVMSLYKGLGPALLRAFPANAACFFGFETTMKFLDQYL